MITSERTTEPGEPSRRRLALETVLWGWLSAVITSSMTMHIWNQPPISELPSVLVLMPFGFAFHTPLPDGWLFWSGFGSALWNRSRAFIIVAVAGSILFGLFWPMHFDAMMGI